MVSLSAHTAAIRKLRRKAREHGCMVVLHASKGGPRIDVYDIVDYDTGQVRGALVAEHRRLDTVDIEEFFATELVG